MRFCLFVLSLNIKVIIKLVVPTKLTSEQKTIIKNLADNTNVDKKSKN